MIKLACVVKLIKMASKYGYEAFLQTKYQDKMFSKINLTVSSYATFDPSNLFVYVPVVRKIAWTARDIMKAEGFRIRYNIYNNLQASK